jgi:nitrite reductase (NADH) small subunit
MRIASMNHWIKVVAVTDIPLLGSRVVQSARGDIALFRTEGDKVFALHDKCPHKGGPLSQGIVHGDRVTCPLHSWNIRLADGSAVAPDVGHTPCIEIKVEAGEVYLNI